MVKTVYCWTLAFVIGAAVAVLALVYQAGFAAVLMFGLLVPVHYATKREKPRRPLRQRGYDRPRNPDRRPV